jgi:hypothetical protein
LARFDHDQRVQARSVTVDSAVIEVSRHDGVRQLVTTQMITLDGHRPFTSASGSHVSVYRRV